MGAAGRDFHNFNVLFRDNGEYEVVCFTAEQIPGISDRKYPKELSGKLYPNGIGIYPESKIRELIKKENIDEIIFSYSDVSNNEIMEKVSIVNSCGADFRLLSATETMLKSQKPVISICAVRTGCGKSQTTSKIASILKSQGKKVVVVRHPMPYGDLSKQIVQRFENLNDLEKHKCTIEEREEYEQHIRKGIIVYAGVDYEKILRDAEKEADIILWDGGNNDTPFFKPDLHVVVADALRPGHEVLYHPGQTNFLMADVLIINKENSAKKESISIILENIRKLKMNPIVVHADSVLELENGGKLDGKKVIIIEDGPTLTHGGMRIGAGYQKAKKHKVEIINCKKIAVGSIKEVYEKYSHLDGTILPAMGYSKKQIQELEQTIKNAKPDAVITGTPIDLGLILKLNIPIYHVKYYIKEKNIELEKILKERKFI